MRFGANADADADSPRREPTLPMLEMTTVIPLPERASAGGWIESLRREWLFGSAESCIAHLLVLSLLILGLSVRGGGKPLHGTMQAVLITLPSPEPEAPVAPPPEQTNVLAKPVEEAKRNLSTPVAPAPPAPAKPKPPAPAKPAQQQAKAGAPGESKSNAQADTPDEGLALIQTFRGNWLRPVGTLPFFRCRLRIDYQPGGIITAVRVEQGCGASSLDDSVERAIWKTQPLPLEAAKTAAGSLVVEFTP